MFTLRETLKDKTACKIHVLRIMSVLYIQYTVHIQQMFWGFWDLLSNFDLSFLGFEFGLPANEQPTALQSFTCIHVTHLLPNLVVKSCSCGTSHVAGRYRMRADQSRA